MLKRRTIVKEFTSRRAMARAVERMTTRGYRVSEQSGEFTHNPFTLRWNRRRVVVTFTRNDESPAAAPEGAVGGE